jgi:hypothetical protein
LQKSSGHTECLQSHARKQALLYNVKFWTTQLSKEWTQTQFLILWEINPKSELKFNFWYFEKLIDGDLKLNFWYYEKQDEAIALWLSEAWTMNKIVKLYNWKKEKM